MSILNNRANGMQRHQRVNKRAEHIFQKVITLKKALKISLMLKSKLSLFICVLGFAFAFLPALISIILEKFSNTILSLSQSRHMLYEAMGLLMVLILLYLLQLSYEFMNAYILAKDKLATTGYIKEQIIKCICRVKYSDIENNKDFKERMAFAESYAGGRVAESIQSVVQVIQWCITFGSLLVILMRVNVWIVVILSITCIPAVILSAFQKDEEYRMNVKWMKEGVWVIHEFFMCCGPESMNEVRHLGIFEFLKGKWKEYSEDYKKKKKELTRKHVMYNSLADILRNIVYIGILLVTAKKIYVNPAIGIGVFLLVLNSAAQFQNAVTKILVLAIQIYNDIFFMEDFFSLENLYQNTDENDEKEEVEKYNISFRNVSFRYPGESCDMIKNLSVEIKDGEKVAIVGENGSGKTTFINLLCGLYSPQKGDILIGKARVNGEINRIRKVVSVVFQNFGKYEESIRKNITVSQQREKTEDGYLYYLLKEVGLLNVVNAFEKKLDEPIGVLSKNGKNLSGGQWQKLALARALNKNNAHIMILDEPTAAMDPIAETELYRKFSAITNNKTTILISHRLGITQLVDKILVFKDGVIVENGTHKELMEKGGIYCKMYTEQSKYYA